MFKDTILINGEIMPLSEAVLEYGDRGWQFGDGVFEVVPVYNGKCFALLPHMESLFNSVIAIKIPGIYTVEELVEFHESLIEETGLVNGEIYTQVTRGIGNGSLEFPEMMVPELTMFAREYDREDTADLQEKGVNVITLPDERWQRGDINSLNRLPEVMAKQKTREAKAYNALFVRDGKITEAIDANLFIVKDEILWTHPDNKLIHPSISRRLLKERLAVDLGLTMVEKAFTVDFALAAEEVFLVGDGCEIMPVIKINREFIADRQPGKVTRDLQKAFKDFVQKECPKRA